MEFLLIPTEKAADWQRSENEKVDLPAPSSAQMFDGLHCVDVISNCRGNNRSDVDIPHPSLSASIFIFGFSPGDL